MDSPPFRSRRQLDGISAVLLPFHPDGRPDLESWAGLLERTWTAGLTPAINMDTGYAQLLNPETRRQILKLAQQCAAGRRFIAGAFIEDEIGDPTALYCRAAVQIRAAGGTPILFPCTAVSTWHGAELVAVFREVGRAVPMFLAFELGQMFVPFGRIWDEATFCAAMEIPHLLGVKHSSLARELEWERLMLRDRHRPDFRVYTGNDLAIDMIQWGSDYLLGLSAFQVEAFAARDRLFGMNDRRWRTLNDWLQYLGMLAFRAPVPAYKHSCAQVLKLRGLIPCDRPHPRGELRPESDLAILAPLIQKLDELVAAV